MRASKVIISEVVKGGQRGDQKGGEFKSMYMMLHSKMYNGLCTLGVIL